MAQEKYQSLLDRRSKEASIILSVFGLLVSIAAAYFAYVANQQNKDIDELKTRIEQLEKANTKAEIESKLKLPVRK